MTTRNPATNPEQKDVWRKPDGSTRRVVNVEDGRVAFTGGIIPVRTLTRAEWVDRVKGWAFVPRDAGS